MIAKQQPAPFEIGTRLRYKRKDVEITFYRNNRDDSDGVVVLKHGVEGIVTKINKGYARHIADLGDGPEEIPPRHGWNTVSIDGYEARAVDCESRKDWEVLS